MMERTIDHKETLMFYDRGQLFVARDQFETLYLCMLVEQDAKAETYLCTPISTRRLETFRAGEFDLREIYKTPETSDTYIAKTKGTYKGITLKAIGQGWIKEKWLPAKGYFFIKEERKSE